MNEIDGVACGTPGCDNRGKPGLNLVGHGLFATKSGRRRRYRCTVCRGTLSTNTGTAYSGLRCALREFDHVASFLRILVAVVRIPMIVQRRDTGTAELPTFLWPHEQRTAA